MSLVPAPPPADILVVDDTPANLGLLCGMLKEQGFQVRPVPRGTLALKAARARVPDLVLLDLGMPEMDGFEVCARMKADPALAEVPVIFLTARAEVADKVRAFAAGGADYVTKPFQFEEVHARVAAHLEIRRQARLLKEGRDRLAELERLRDGLVQMMVHDLRSPLAALQTLLEVFQADHEDRLAPEGRTDLEDAVGILRKMSGMISSILDVSRMEAGRLVPARVACDLGGIAAEVVRVFAPLARGREVSVQGDGAGRPILADRELISRALQNLLSNALKHTRPGGCVRIAIEDCGRTARVSVTDDGPGIPAEYRERIFDKFVQVEARASGVNLPSSGLGLAFCRLAVEAHGGRIGVDSEVGHGSRFWLELPRDGAA